MMSGRVDSAARTVSASLAAMLALTGECAAAPPMVCSTKNPSPPSSASVGSRSTVTWSSPSPVLRIVVVRWPFRVCVPPPSMVSLPEPLQ